MTKKSVTVTEALGLHKETLEAWNFSNEVNEETIQQALEVLRGRDINVTREELIEKLEIEIGKEIKII